MTAQLDLLRGIQRRAPVAPDVARTAAQVLWLGAGRPEPEEIADVRPSPCWWCGHPTGARGRPLSTLADTFPSAHLAASPSSRVLCRPCGWTLSDHVAMPEDYARERIVAKAAAGRREIVSVRGAPAERRLLLALADGSVGLWACAENAAGEEPWVARVAELREAPADVGPCRYLGAVPVADLGDAPVYKFRAFHHLGTARSWKPCTDSDKPAIRAWLLSPPAEPWAGVIGDGKKHAAIYGRVSTPGGNGLQTVAFQGACVDYLPADLARQVTAWEALVLAGARDEEIETGHYTARGLDLLRAQRAHDSTLAPIRGSAAVGLVRYLRRRREDLA